MNDYFDFHFHPLAKHQFRPNEEETLKKIGIASYTKKIEMSKGFMDFTDEVILRMLESQSCVDQLKKGDVTLGVAAISALEFGIASSKSFFYDLMKTGFAQPFDQEYFEAIKEGEISYLNLFFKEIQKYLKLRILDKKTREHTDESKLNFLGRFNDSKVLLKGKRTNLVFGIEGGHNLCTKKIGNALEYDTFKDFSENGLFDSKMKSSKDPAKALELLVNALWGAQMDVLYLTLTHLTHIPEQHLATHAFGTKMLKHPSFYPFGNGLSDLGKNVVHKAYKLEHSTGKHSPILIDIKHMSLKSRLDLYKLREETRGVEDKVADRQKGGKGKLPRDYTKIPLIATHVGVTGYSINDWKDNLDFEHCSNHVDQGIKTIKMNTKAKVAGYWGSGNRIEFTFNPNTINLMDEDIIEIVESKGLIGVGLDVRLLGSDSNTNNNGDTYEFLSTAEFVAHFPYTGIRSLDFTKIDEIKSEEKWLKPARKVMHPLSLCFNIVHVLAVIKLKTGVTDEESKNYVCIGSDFDGFIEPLKVCGGSEQMKELEANLLKWLPVAAKRYLEENGGADDLFAFTKKKQKLEKVVKAILYENGRRFLKEQGYFSEDTKGAKIPSTKEKSEAQSV